MKKIIVILIFLVIISGCSLKPNKKQEELDKEKISELLKNNYLYSVFALTNNLDEQTKTESEAGSYNFVITKGIKTLEELNDLIQDVFIEEMYEKYYNLLYDNKNYISFDNKIYANIIGSTCDIGSDYDFDDFKIVNQNEDNFIISYEEIEYFVYIDRDKYLLGDNIFKCLSEKEIMKNMTS